MALVADTSPTKHGVVYTRRWVVELILDLVGYASSEPLHNCLIVEPSAGDGSFLVVIAERLVESCKRYGVDIRACLDSIRAFELDPESARAARAATEMRLVELGVAGEVAEMLSGSWVRSGDFLLDSADLSGQTDYVVGNPPYIRLEELGALATLYRSTYHTMTGRADVYVAFYEAALRLLKHSGVMGFICADRWMYNQYGSELRRLITSGYSVEVVLQMHDADAFATEVSAYPAVTVIRRSSQRKTVVAILGHSAVNLGAREISATVRGVLSTGEQVSAPGLEASRLDSWFRGDAGWPLLPPSKLELLKKLEQQHYLLESTGASVGIGVATGADKVFVTTDQDAVEPERLLPLAMALDARESKFKWSGRFLVNPWDGRGLVNLRSYPKLEKYLNAHRDQLCGRHVGQKSASGWYRTIDRVDPGLTRMSKLYLPDFKGRIAPVLDCGETYPHHNLYYIVSTKWDLSVLGGLLLSDVAQFFIEAYGVRMRGGYLRFQAQYLRKIRVPRPESIPAEDAAALRLAFDSHDVELANQVAARLYGLDTSEERLLGDRG